MYIFLDCSLFRLGGRCIISSVFSTFLRLLSFRSFIYGELVHELLSERCLHNQESAANGTVTDEESPGINGDCVPESAGYYTSRLYPQTRRGRKSWSCMYVKQHYWHRQVIIGQFSPSQRHSSLSKRTCTYAKTYGKNIKDTGIRFVARCWNTNLRSCIAMCQCAS